MKRHICISYCLRVSSGRRLPEPTGASCLHHMKDRISCRVGLAPGYVQYPIAVAAYLRSKCRSLARPNVLGRFGFHGKFDSCLPAKYPVVFCQQARVVDSVSCHCFIRLARASQTDVVSYKCFAHMFHTSVHTCFSMLFHSCQAMFTPV